MSTRAIWLLAVLLASCVASCGGKVVVPGDPGDGSVPTDTSPAATCGSGTCTPGTTCSPDGGCNRCSCDSSGRWACTLRDCLDASPPPPPPPTCPDRAPAGGVPCLNAITCVYKSACGSKITAICEASRWNVSVAPCS